MDVHRKEANQEHLIRGHTQVPKKDAKEINPEHCSAENTPLILLSSLCLLSKHFPFLPRSEQAMVATQSIIPTSALVDFRCPRLGGVRGDTRRATPQSDRPISGQP